MRVGLHVRLACICTRLKMTAGSCSMGGCTGVHAIEAFLRVGEQVWVVAALAQLHDEVLQLRPGPAVLVVLQPTQQDYEL